MGTFDAKPPHTHTPGDSSNVEDTPTKSPTSEPQCDLAIHVASRRALLDFEPHMARPRGYG